MPYDYRDFAIFTRHRHGPPNEAGNDENGHFGGVNGCLGRVIHIVSDSDVVVSSEESPHPKYQLKGTETDESVESETSEDESELPE